MFIQKTFLPLLMVFVFAACQPADKNNEAADSTADTTQTSDSTTVKDGEEPLKSPPDSTSATLGDLTVKVRYGSPAVRGRKIWDGLVPYGKVWRTGANEATTFAVSQDVRINNEPLPAGRYSLFTIPTDSTWTVIFNKVPDQWGAYEYNAEEDALRIQVNPVQMEEMNERMHFTATAKAEEIEVRFHWEHLGFTLTVKPQ